MVVTPASPKQLNLKMSDTCFHCSKTACTAEVEYATCTAKFHKSCADRCLTGDLGVYKGCKNSRPTSLATGRAYSQLHLNTAPSQSSGKSNKKDKEPAYAITTLRAAIEKLTATVITGVSNRKSDSDSLSNSMKNIEGKLARIGNLKVSVDSLSLRVDKIKHNLPNSTSNTL